MSFSLILTIFLNEATSEEEGRREEMKKKKEMEKKRFKDKFVFFSMVIFNGVHREINEV